MKNFVTLLIILVVIIAAIVLIKRAGGTTDMNTDTENMLIDDGSSLTPEEQDGDMIEEGPGAIPQ